MIRSPGDFLSQKYSTIYFGIYSQVGKTLRNYRSAFTNLFTNPFLPVSMDPFPSSRLNTLNLLVFHMLFIAPSSPNTYFAVLASPCKRLNSIISFGDSLADTGNLLHLSTSNIPPHFAVPPYGETYFHTPTGRFSNGRLIIDFLGAFLLLLICLMHMSEIGLSLVS